MACLGELGWEENKLDEVQEYLETALEIRKRLLGDRHLHVAETLHLLVKVYRKQHLFGQAVQRLTEASDIFTHPRQRPSSNSEDSR